MRTFTCGLILAMLTITSAALSADDDFKLEPGFELIFNGKDLTGWKVRGGDSLDGKTQAPKGRFTVTDGKLVINEKVKGNMVLDTLKSFSNDVHLKFQYMPGPGCNNDLYFRGLKFDLKKADVKNLKEGQWNDFEIIIQGSKVEFKNNGQTQRSGTAKSQSTPLGIRAEIGPCQYRHLRIKSGA